MTGLLPPQQCLASAFWCLIVLSYTVSHLEPGKSWVQGREFPAQVDGVSLGDGGGGLHVTFPGGLLAVCLC